MIGLNGNYYSPDEYLQDVLNTRQVFSLAEGGGYDWHEALCVYAPSTRRYYVAEGSGCSCNSFLDSWNGQLDSLTSYPSKADVIRWIDGLGSRGDEQWGYGFHADQITAAKADVHRFKVH